jgi:hypothetical protein
MARTKHVPTISPQKRKRNSSSPGSDSSPKSAIGTSNFAKLEAQWEAKARRYDGLLQKPKRNHSYIRADGEAVASDGRFDVVAQSARQMHKRPHPKVTAARNNGTLTAQLEQYYQGFEVGQHKGKAAWQHMPLAGYCRESPALLEVLVSHLPSTMSTTYTQILATIHSCFSSCT